MRREGDELARYEAVPVLVACQAQWGAGEEGGEIECGQDVEDDDFVGGVCVDGVVEGERGGVVVVG